MRVGSLSCDKLYNMFNLKNIMLMKKIALLLVGLLVMFSCEQEDWNGIVDSNTTQVQTRATTSIADFDPIAELANVPVNVINVGNTKYKYLTVGPTGKDVWLTETDDGSMRQRWYLKGGNLVLVGGNSFPIGSPVVVPELNKDYPVLGGYSAPFVCSPFKAYNDDSYYIEGFSPVPGPLISYVYAGYLQAKDETSSDLKYRTSNSSAISRWKVVPVGEYRIVNMEYVETAGDFINRKDQSIDGAIVPNISATQEIEHSISISKTAREKSSFTEAEGISTTEGSSFNLNGGLDVGIINIGIGGTIDNSTTSSRTVTYGTEEEYTVNVTQTFKIIIPPMTTYRIEVLKMSYDASVTYVATLEKMDGNDKGQRFKIKGKWDGIVTTYLYYNLYIMDTNELVETRIIS
ncbi:hypothetical protein DWX97_23150 [Bacteroides cellulosilyticus]|uniref:Uncharacterized protein n=3 Tax=Bacteroides cellulosilyticus TaxID=246787 RepID=A0A412I812_9BACE|nr:hypothetical protein DWX97_23150 [Bacteroides cellulosilyticus]